MDHRVDSDGHNVELITLATMSVATMLACDAQEDFICLQRLVLYTKSRISIVVISRHLLLDKITKEVSVFMPEQCYLFIVKYLVIAALELLEFKISPAALPLPFLLLLL